MTLVIIIIIVMMIIKIIKLYFSDMTNIMIIII